MFTQAIKKGFVNTVMICGQQICIFKGDLLRRGEGIQGLIQIQIRNLFFCELVSCTLQEPGIQSGKTVIVPGDTQAQQLDEFFGYIPALTSRDVKFKVLIEQRLAVGQPAKRGSISPPGF